MSKLISFFSLAVLLSGCAVITAGSGVTPERNSRAGSGTEMLAKSVQTKPVEKRQQISSGPRNRAIYSRGIGADPASPSCTDRCGGEGAEVWQALPVWIWPG
jgi:hypothetical protein